jgi:hypothetical protein
MENAATKITTNASLCTEAGGRGGGMNV